MGVIFTVMMYSVHTLGPFDLCNYNMSCATLCTQSVVSKLIKIHRFNVQYGVK